METLNQVESQSGQNGEEIGAGARVVDMVQRSKKYGQAEEGHQAENH